VVVGVVDDVVGADRGDQVGLGRAAHAGDLCTEGLGDLHGERADAARCAGDQHVLAWPEAPGVAQALQGGQPGDRHGGGLGDGEAGRLAGELVRAGARVLGERTVADAEHLLADREPGDIGADGRDRAGHVEPGHGVSGGAQARDQADQVRLARHEVPGTPVQSGGVDPEEDLAVTGGWPADLRQMQDVGGAVSGLHDRPHALLRRRCRRGCAAGSGGRGSPAGWPCRCVHGRVFLPIPWRRRRCLSSVTRWAGARSTRPAAPCHYPCPSKAGQPG
jgi:hypothetical protein